MQCHVHRSEVVCVCVCFFCAALPPPMFPIKHHFVVDSCTSNVMYINYRAGAPIYYCNVMAIDYFPKQFTVGVLNSFLNRCPAWSRWWCPALPMSRIHLSPQITIHFVSQSGWWCPGLRLSPIHLSPRITIHLSPSLAGGVRLSRCLQFICLPI